MVKKCIVLFAAVMVLIALSINADAGPASSGFYFGGGASYAWENFDTDDIEDLVNWYDDFDAEAGPIDFEVKIWTFMLDLKAMYPFYEDRLTPYLRIGGGYMDAEIEVGSLDDSESDFAFNLGVGLDFYVTDQISIGPDAKYVWGAGDLDELEYFVATFSVAFHF